MKILILCNKPPFPPTEGGPIAMNMIIEGLISAGHSVKVLAFNSNKTNVDSGAIPEEYRQKTGLEMIPVDLSVKPFEAFINLFTSKSYHVERFINIDFEKRLEEILKKENFDVVQFEMLYMSPYLETVKKYSKAKTILRAHNIEYLIWERVEKTCSDRVKRAYLHHLVRTLKKYELEVINKFDGIAAITWKDAAFFRDHMKKNGHNTLVTDIPFGIDPASFPAGNEDFDFPSFFSIGSMDWMPNEEGIRWFLSEIWPEITRNFPDVNYHIAGRHMPEWITRCNRPGVIVEGEVPDAAEFMHSKAVMIVPLLSGSGIRIKIIEGMAAGKCIISTSIGAEGIHYTDGDNILIADTKEQFIEAVRKSLQKETCLSIGGNARRLIETEYDRKQIISKLTAFYEKAGT